MTAPEFIPRTRSGPIEAGASARARATALESHYGHRSNGGPEITDGVIDLLRAILGDPDGVDGRWMVDALCAQVDIGDVFFPEQGGAATDARAICALCDVRDSCREWALEHPNALEGVWAGMSERERQAVRGARFRPNHPDRVTGVAA